MYYKKLDGFCLFVCLFIFAIALLKVSSKSVPV